MAGLMLMQPGNQGNSLLMVRLIDPNMAEYEVKSALGRMGAKERLCLAISCRHPDWTELMLIASCLQRANPSIVICADTENALLST